MFNKDCIQQSKPLDRRDMIVIGMPPNLHHHHMVMEMAIAHQPPIDGVRVASVDSADVALTSMFRKQILVVDDMPPIIKNLQKLASEYVVDYGPALSGQENRRKNRKNRKKKYGRKPKR